MVQLIVGNKGKGKTKIILDKVNAEVLDCLGTVVYLDKSTKHMFDLNNKVRLINVPDFDVNGTDGFLGFISGIISQDRDLEKVFIDSFLVLADIENKDVAAALRKIDNLSRKFSIDFIISMSVEEDELPEEFKDMVIASL